MLDVLALDRKIVEWKMIDIGDQISFPVAVGDMLVIAQELIALVKTVAEVKRIAKNKILVVKYIDHGGASRADEQPNRFAARTIEMNVGGVQRNGEDRSRPPLEGHFGLLILPHRRRAAPLGDVNDLFEQMALRQGLAARRNIANVSIRTLLGGQIEITAQHPHALPLAQLQSCHVLHHVTANNGNAFLLLQ